VRGFRTLESKVEIEERFLSAQADTFAGSEREKKKRRPAPLGMTVLWPSPSEAGPPQLPISRTLATAEELGELIDRGWCDAH
jgi:hypothetical protein